MISCNPSEAIAVFNMHTFKQRCGVKNVIRPTYHPRLHSDCTGSSHAETALSSNRAHLCPYLPQRIHYGPDLECQDGGAAARAQGPSVFGQVGLVFLGR